MARGSLATLLLLLALPASASAATVSAEVVEGDPHAVSTLWLDAAAGERNELSLVSAGDGGVLVSDAATPLTAGAGCVALDAHAARCRLVDVARAWVTLGDGDDGLAVDVAEPYDFVVDAGAGADEVDVSVGGGVVHIEGRDGDDGLRGATDLNDVLLHGGDGDDSLVGESSSLITLVGQGGSDELRLVAGGGLALGGGFDDDPVQDPDGDDTIFGGDVGDKISGGPGDDTIHGGAGADWIAGEGGDDTIRGGGGDDRLIGGEPDCPPSAVDPLDCASKGDADGADRLDPGPGSDHVYAGLGTDRIDARDLLPDRVLDCGADADADVLLADLLDPEPAGTCEQVRRSLLP